MPAITTIVGVILCALGLVGYFFLGGDTKSITALIPAFFGVPLVLLGLLARKPSRRAVMMHIAVLLGVLGLAGTARGLAKAPALFSDPESLERPTAIAVQSIMAVVCLVFVALCVKSFIAARRKSA